MSPSETVAAPAIDPTFLAILGIFGGAALAAIAGLIGAAIQGRREHSKWVRERRFDAYSRFYKLVRRYSVASSVDGIQLRDFLDVGEIPDAHADLKMIGPEHVVDAGLAYKDASVRLREVYIATRIRLAQSNVEEDPQVIAATKDENEAARGYIAVARKALDI